MNFTAIDFETAIGKRWSICQVGIVIVENGEIVKSFSRFVQPPNNEYSIWNTRVHGISASDTATSPTFPEVWGELETYFRNRLVVAHNSDFDIDCLFQTLDYYDISKPSFEIDCTYRRTGQKLKSLCDAYDIQLTSHHNAEHDAIGCAKVYLNILNNVVPDYSKINSEPVENKFAPKGHEKITGDVLKPDLTNADPTHPFYNKKVVFTGVLESIGRKDAAVIVKGLGADIDTAITKRTKYVITGKAPGPSKMKKIESYNQSGGDIEIILEEEFLKMINHQ